MALIIFSFDHKATNMLYNLVLLLNILLLSCGGNDLLGGGLGSLSDFHFLSSTTSIKRREDTAAPDHAQSGFGFKSQ